MELRDALELRIAVGGSEVRVVTAGTGSPAVLFDSPLGTPLDAWSLVAPTVAERTQVILWDRPGLGRSGPPVSLDAEGMAAAIESVIGRAGASSVVGVGHSRGGINVLALAACRPHLVAGLVLVESSHPEQSTRMRVSDGPMLGAVRVLARVPRPLAQLPAFGVRGLVRIAGRRVRPGARVMAELAPVVAGRLDGLVAEHDAGPALLADVSDKLRERGFPHIPLTVLTGDNNYSDPSDQKVWAAMHAELAALSDRGVHVHVECGHEMPFSNPDAVIDAVAGVLDDVTRPTT